MKEGIKIEFQKWEGTGNTFVMIDDRERDIEEFDSELIQRICIREETDGIIFIRPSSNEQADLFCDFRNPDGSISFCGNGTRATYAYARREGWVGDEAIFEACDGLHKVRWNSDLNLPSVEFENVEVPKEVEGDWFVNTGSPHHIFRVDSPETLKLIDIQKIGSEIRYSEKYQPQGTNVSGLSNTSEESKICLRTYERGVEAETEACGTGAVAAALIDHTINGGNPSRKVKMPGGDLHVEFDPVTDGYKSVWLSGKASELRRGIITFLLALLPFFSQAQTQWHENLSDQTQISVLTASPGEDIYSLFGHTAIRVYDPLNLPESDWVFNYGTFSFNDGFYFKFVKGRLDYKLTVEPYHHFFRIYHQSERGIKSQTLNLNSKQVKAVAKYLEWNAKSENATYSYEFFRNNCASRIITVLEEALGESLETNCQSDGRTYRDGLKPYIACTPWTEFGMDFILGPEADKVMEGCAAAYIPDELYLALERMEIDSMPLVKYSEELIISPTSWMNAESFVIAKFKSPDLLFFLLLILVALLRYLVGESNLVTKIVVKTIQIVAALLGVLLLVMWLFTDHIDTWGNWNLIWTTPMLATLINRKGLILSYMAFAGYLIVGPFIWPQLVTLSLWLVAITVFLTVTPKTK